MRLAYSTRSLARLDEFLYSFQFRLPKGSRDRLRNCLRIYFQRTDSNLNRLCCFAAQGNLDSIDGVDRRVASRGAMQRFYLCIGHEPHVHEVILHAGRQIQRYQDSAFAHFEIAQLSQSNSSIRPGLPGRVLPERTVELRPDQSDFSIRPFRSGLQRVDFAVPIVSNARLFRCLRHQNRCDYSTAPLSLYQ